MWSLRATKLRMMRSRPVIGQVLLVATGFALAGAVLLELTGGAGHGMRPVAFVTGVMGLNLALFAFWPALRSRGASLNAAFRGAMGAFTETDPDAALTEDRDSFRLHQRQLRPGAVLLWDEHDPRLELALFTANVPTFVLSAEQRFLDWNPAFELAFAPMDGVKRGGHVSEWYAGLDNFKRVAKRTDKLYGEGILPVTDRERVTYVSPRWGRMVFTRIMAPVVDQRSGRIIGWTVTLNINSVNKREEFFRRLYDRIASESRRVRYAASVDHLLESAAGFRRLRQAAVAPLARATRVLDLGCGSGLFTGTLLAQGSRVTAVDLDLHLLRKVKDRTAGYETRSRIVRQNPASVHGLPAAAFDGVILGLNTHRFPELDRVLASAAAALKPGGIAVVSGVTANAGIDGFYRSVHAGLEAGGSFEELKHQFNHVVDYERDLAASTPFVPRDEARLAELARAAGFEVLESARHCDGSVVLMTLRKS